jgi:hypothetical protein
MLSTMPNNSLGYFAPRYVGAKQVKRAGPAGFPVRRPIILMGAAPVDSMRNLHICRIVFLTDRYHLIGSLTVRSTLAFGNIFIRSFQYRDIG